ncbi:MAG: TonB-dependent receptor [Ignavibacteriales bacterium]|nr:TonB-dependent receptor [Ignavibacteriales bacterium]
MKTSVSLFIIVLLPAILFGQSMLRGVVIDSTSGEKLVGVNVVIVGTGLGAATSIDGEYRITGIRESRMTVRVSCIGYEVKLKVINFAVDKEARFDAALVPTVIIGKEFVITAQRRGQIAAINQQVTASTITNVVSEEKIQELPDANAAEAIGRLPGISLLRSGGEASSVVMRGLSSKFSLITIDGVRMAPTSDVDRSVDLSTISQGSLAGIELSKALTSDKDADAIAGSVNLVTKKAPSARMLRIEPKGSYNAMDKSANQYNGSIRYGERFFDDLLGVQVSGNLESTIRSNESTNYNYDVTGIQSGKDYEITQFQVMYIHELRKRGGSSLLLDYTTPDMGSIRFNTVFNQTSRNYLTSYKQYPQSGTLTYDYRQTETNISTFSTSLQGENYLLGLQANWNISFSQSKRNDPFDYEMNLTETSASVGGQTVSGMRTLPPALAKGPVEDWIPYAMNDFQDAFVNSATDRGQTNLDREKGAFLDLIEKYSVSNYLTGELKFGGKYRQKSRFGSPLEFRCRYYLIQFPQYTKLENGTIVRKNLTGTQFENIKLVGADRISFANFLSAAPPKRSIYGKYDLNPLINVDGLKLWRQLNINGYSDPTGTNPEYWRNNEIDGQYYDLTESVLAGYAMNIFNFGSDATFIAGARVESDDNKYSSRYTKVPLMGDSTPTGLLTDTTVYHKEHVVLPNFQGILRPTAFMNIRLAAYQALARPDYNQRLLKFVARATNNNYEILIGNPQLKNAIAWNYEAQTQFYGNSIGLFSVSAFYKDIKDMYHTISGVMVYGQGVLDSLGIPWKQPFGNSYYTFTYPYNSSKPTRVWGFEVEHQTDFNFLPQPFKNIVLNYNFSIVRSETWVTTSRVETFKDSTLLFGRWIYTTGSKNVLFEKKQKLEDQPEFFGNASLGYDIGGFSFRVSVFYQGKYNISFSSDQRSDAISDSFTKWDITLRQKVTDNISVSLNLNNITNSTESTTLADRVTNWMLPDVSNKYGMTADLGVRIEL